MDWQKVLSRLSVPGLTLLLAGAILVTQSAKLCRLVFKQNPERATLWLRVLGLAAAVLGAVILLDLIPGW